jgi:hypothetical protein
VFADFVFVDRCGQSDRRTNEPVPTTSVGAIGLTKTESGIKSSRLRSVARSHPLVRCFTFSEITVRARGTRVSSNSPRRRQDSSSPAERDAFPRLIQLLFDESELLGGCALDRLLKHVHEEANFGGINGQTDVAP